MDPPVFSSLLRGDCFPKCLRRKLFKTQATIPLLVKETLRVERALDRRDYPGHVEFCCLFQRKVLNSVKSVIPCVKLATEEEGRLTRELVFLQCRNKEKGTVQPGTDVCHRERFCTFVP